MPIRELKQSTEEQAVFKAFLDAYQSFATTVATVDQPEGEFPDVIVRLKGGSEIQFELVEWLHPHQMAMGKRRERLAEAIDLAIGEQGDNWSQYFDLVLLFPKPSFPRFDRVDEKSFGTDVWALVEETERRWTGERFWHSPTGRQVSNLESYPILSKYLAKVIFYPSVVAGVRQERLDGVPWIAVSAPCGSYSSTTAMNALNAALQAKLKAYGALHQPVQLLVYYGAAVAYNTPWFGLKLRTFGDVAENAARIVENQSAFERIYLLKALEPNLEVYEIFPQLMKCQ